MQNDELSSIRTLPKLNTLIFSLFKENRCIWKEHVIKNNSLRDSGQETEGMIPVKTKYLYYQIQMKPTKESAATN